MFTLRRNIILGLGAAALLAGALLASLWLRHVAATRSESVHTEYVMAAASNIAPGTLLHLDDMTWVAIDPTTQRKNFIVKGTANPEDYEGALARQSFQAGTPFTSDGLLRSTDRNFLSAVLSPGARALTLPVEAQQSSSGLVRPGDRVDVILTQNLGDAAPDPGHRVVAETLLRDILVVAVERALTPGSAPKAAAGFGGAATEAAIPKTITLQVTEEQAQKLLVAAQLGKVDLVERALVMGVTPPSLTVRNTWAYDVSPALGALRGKPASQQPSQSTPPTAPPSTSAHGTIEVMHGSKVEIR